MTACSFWLDIHARRNKSDQLIFLADIHVRRKKSMISIDHTFLELPFTVEHQRGGGLYAFTALVVARVILEGLLLEV